jgi:Tfp pilus assembly protein PilO
MINRVWFIGTAIATIGVLALGWFLGVSPRLSEVAASNADRQAAQTVNDQQVAGIAALKEKFSSIEDVQQELDELRLALPSTVELDQFINQIGAAADEQGVSVVGFTSDDPAVFGVVAAEVPIATEGEATPSPAATPAATDAVATPPLADALLDPANFITVKVSVTVEGEYGKILAFLAQMQDNPRLFLVSDLDIGVKEATISAKVDGYIYVLLDPTTADSAAVDPATAP